MKMKTKVATIATTAFLAIPSVALATEANGNDDDGFPWGLLGLLGLAGLAGLRRRDDHVRTTTTR